MRSYLNLLGFVRHNGLEKPDTRFPTTGLFARQIRHDLADGFPLLTTKKMRFDYVLAELLWFLSGRPDINTLKEHCPIWNPWADERGVVPSAYGHFWRTYPCAFGDLWIDQIQKCITGLKKSPWSRRYVVLAWEPGNAWNSSLPPCHYTFCLNKSGDGRLNLHVTMRSADIPVGVPYNIASYALLLHMIAMEVDMIPGEVAITMVDAHIYTNQLGLVDEQLKRKPRALPKLILPCVDFESLTIENFASLSERIKVEGYNPWPHIPYPVSV